MIRRLTIDIGEDNEGLRPPILTTKMMDFSTYAIGFHPCIRCSSAAAVVFCERTPRPRESP
jgi:hypothetical protein